MIEIRKGTLTNEDTVKQLIDLSQVWVEENSTFGLIKNTRKHISLLMVIKCAKIALSIKTNAQKLRFLN